MPPKSQTKGGKKKKKKTDKAKGDSPPGSDEKKRLTADLVLAQGRQQVSEAAAKGLEEEVWALREQAAEREGDQSDVLQSQQRENEALTQEVRRLRRELQAAGEAVAGLQVELRRARDASSEALAGEAQEGEEETRRLLRLISRGQKEREALEAKHEADQLRMKQRVQGLMAELEAAGERIKGLTVRAAWQAMLRFSFDDPWLVTVHHNRLTGALPPAKPGCVACCTAGKWVVLWSTAETAEGAAALSRIHLLSLETLSWQPASLQVAVPALEGHAAVSVGAKLVAIGGKSMAGLQTGERFFSPATQQFMLAPPPEDPRAVAPAARWGHALAWCPVRNAVYLFGGMSSDGPSNDLWAWCLKDMRWQQLSTIPSTRVGADAHTLAHATPEPRTNAALAVSPDGSRLWLFGGCSAAGRPLGDLKWYDIHLHAWTTVQANEMQLTIEPRERHVMTCLGRFVLVVGGSAANSAGERRPLADTCVFDPASSRWDRLDSAAFDDTFAPESGRAQKGTAHVSLASSSTNCPSSSQGGTGGGGSSRGRLRLPEGLSADNCLFDAGRLLVLQPDPATGLLNSLLSVHFLLPDEIERRRAAKARKAAVVQQLTLAPQAESVTSSSLCVSWVAPSQRRDQILHYKLLLSTLDCRTREVYQGLATACEINGLPPAQEVVVAVKATYDDASFCWSEARAYHTLPKKS